ncbi:MAG TPA: hypothetical protein VGP93_03875, partial [Polyangiaceae bacterium]|nr:hypothetical protein [Polyangiaceae bacterium]
RLSLAAQRREQLARDVREPESVPAALCLSREALALSVSALLAARGKLEGAALSPAKALDALGELNAAGELGTVASEGLVKFLSSDDPAHSDELPPEARRALQDELEKLLAEVRNGYEPRSPRQVALLRGIRFGLVLLGVVVTLAWLLLVKTPS